VAEFLIFALAAAALLLAAALLVRGSRARISEDLLHKLRMGGQSAAAQEQAEAGPSQLRWPLREYAEAWLRRSGVEAQRSFLIKVAIADVVVALLVALFTTPWVGLLALLVLVPAAVWVYLVGKAGRRKSLIILALPNFLDGMVRVTRVGASLPAALLAVTKESTGPIRGLFLQVVTRQQAGLSLEQAMKNVGDFYDIEELGLISSVLRLNQRYGGRTDLVLERIAEWMRSRVAAQAEFSALAAETKLSAVMLSVLIPGIGAFIIINNFSYIAGMWHDPTGKLILIAAFALLLTGIFTLMRMSKLRN
jgi:tight adherence protein B